jgi:hypothetical protein
MLAHGGYRPGQPGHCSTSVVHPQQERAQRRVPDHAQRTGVNLDPLAQIQVHAEAVRDHRLDDIPV